MGGRPHDVDALAVFQGGETRLVYARKVDDPSGALYFLEDGQAAEVKKWAAGRLECFMPVCPDRRFKVVNRSKGRDGFSHYTGSGGHSPEGLFHQQAKALVVRWVAWLAETKGWTGLTAIAEQTTADGSRRADVMVSGPGGQRVAVEIQYAGLSVNEWQTRNSSYLEQGITPVWLFGHVGTHLKRYRYTREHHPNPQIALSAVHQAAAETGQRLLWINPISSRIGFAWAVRHSERRQFRTHIWPDDHVAEFTDVDIRECTITPEGIFTPFSRDLSDEQEAGIAVLDREAEDYRRQRDREEWRQQRYLTRRAERERERQEAAAAEATRKREILNSPSPHQPMHRERAISDQAARTLRLDELRHSIARRKEQERRAVDGGSGSPVVAPRALTRQPQHLAHVCRVCGTRLAAEFGHIGGHPGTCIPLEMGLAEDPDAGAPEPPTLFD